MNLRKSFLLFSALGLIFLGNVSQASAQAIGITVSPVRIEDLVEPGQIIKQQVRVKNDSDIQKTFYPYLKDFKAGDEAGTPLFVKPGSEEGYFLAEWIKIPTDGIDFQPGEEKTIDFIISVPENAGPGGYAGALFFGTKPVDLSVESEDRGAGMATAQQVGCLVLMQIKGDVNEQAEIREFGTDRGIYWNLPYAVSFLTRIQNAGNSHVRPIGDIRISNFLGKEVAVVKVNENVGNVLPGSIRKFATDWKGKFGFGKYQASVFLNYGTNVEDGGEGRQTLNQKTSFWILPWKIISISVGTALLIVGLLVFFLRMYKNKAVMKAMSRAGVNVKQIKRVAESSPMKHLFLIFIVVSLLLFLVISLVYFQFFS